ncbi:hypothetical protein HYR99_24515 [Candidatus Poribacteria bacterium]|nr:hypothetical protein [Candidatus Poribacteria bacterium]
MEPIQNLEELIQTLEQHPEWQERLLKVLLTGEFRRLPDRMDRLESVVAQLAEQMQALTQQVQALAEGQQQLQLQMQALAESQQELRVQMQALAEGQRQLQVQMQALTTRMMEFEKIQRGMQDDLGYLKGRDQERFYRENASAVFGRYLRKVKVMDKGALLDQMNETKALADKEWEEIVNLDLAVEAVTRQTGRPLVLAMEVSWIIDPGDVERAIHRAALMQERGLPAIPVVGGKGLLPNAKDSAQLHRVLVLLDGRIFDKEFLE